MFWLTRKDVARGNWIHSGNFDDVPKWSMDPASPQWGRKANVFRPRSFRSYSWGESHWFKWWEDYFIEYGDIGVHVVEIVTIRRIFVWIPFVGLWWTKAKCFSSKKHKGSRFRMRIVFRFGLVIHTIESHDMCQELIEIRVSFWIERDFEQRTEQIVQKFWKIRKLTRFAIDVTTLLIVVQYLTTYKRRGTWISQRTLSDSSLFSTNHFPSFPHSFGLLP